MKRYYKEKRLLDFRELVNRSAMLYPKKAAFVIKKGEGYDTIPYTRLQAEYYALCNAFFDRGLVGRRIAVIGRNSYEWVLCYLAAATVGVVVPLDKEIDSADIANFLTLSESAAVCMDDAIDARDGGVCYSGAERILFSELGAICGKGEGDRKRIDDLPIPADKMQILLFTSGTTGFSKGVCLSQQNVLSNIYSTVRIVKIQSRDRTMSILPLHHTYECTLDCLLILSRGACITYAESLTKLAKNISEYRPSVLVVVPALLKSLHKRILAKVRQGLPEKYRALFEETAFSAAMKKLPFLIRLILCKKVKKSLGGKLRLFIVGAAELDAGIVEDFTALGIRTLQGYGLTECSPLLAGNSDFYFNAATTGVAIPDVTLKIDTPSGDGIGEILARGDNIMLGYFNDPEETARVFADGWFHTGDLGYLDKDGALTITGRCKSVIVAENGKNIYPEELEARIATFSEVEEVIVVPHRENDKTQIKVKLLPCLDFLKEKLGHIPGAEEIKKQMEAIIAEINRKIPDYKRIRIVEVLTQALEKTTTRKVKRFGVNLA